MRRSSPAATHSVKRRLGAVVQRRQSRGNCSSGRASWPEQFRREVDAASSSTSRSAHEGAGQSGPGLDPALRWRRALPSRSSTAPRSGRPCRRRHDRDLRAPALQRAARFCASSWRREQQHVARRCDHARRPAACAARVEHDAQRLPAAVVDAHFEARIVGEHGADAREHHGTARAQVLHVAARRLAGDPAALAVGQRGAAIEAGGQLHAHERPATAPCASGSRRSALRLRRPSDPLSTAMPCLAQARRAGARHLGIRIVDGIHHARARRPRSAPGCRVACGRDDCRVRASRRRWRRAPRRRRAVSAATSACGSPARSCQPSPTISPSRTSTQPTRGFGSVLYRPRCASSSARAWRRSHRSSAPTNPRSLLVLGRFSGRAGQQRQLVAFGGLRRRLCRWSISWRKASTSWKLRYTDAKRT